MTEQDEPVLSSALLEARPRPAAAVLRLYTPYYEQLLRYYLPNREFIEQRDAPSRSRGADHLTLFDCDCIRARARADLSSLSLR